MFRAFRYSQLCEANGAHRPYDNEPDHTAGGDDSAQHRDILRLGAVGERAHARNGCQGELLGKVGCFLVFGGVRSLATTMCEH